MRPNGVVSRNFTLVSPHLFRVRLRSKIDPPDAVAVPSAPLAPPSSSLPRAELEARLLRYGARARARLPLFGDGPPAPPEPVTACMGCGVVPSRPTHLTLIGWAVVTHADVSFREIYCPECRDA